MQTPTATWTRRRFLKTTVAAGVTLAMSTLTLRSQTFDEREAMPIAPGWSGKNGFGQSRYRIDGYAKVTGAKLYARDFRAADMPGWPNVTSHAMLLCAPDATHRFTGIDLSLLGEDLQPDRIVTKKDLADAELKGHGFFEANLMCAVGETPGHLGQPVALLIYKNLEAFLTARARLRGASGVVNFGEDTGPVEADPYGGNRFTRVGGPDSTGPDVYSPVKDGWVRPLRFRKNSQPVWAAAKIDGNAAQQASEYGEQIRKDLSEGRSGKVYKHHFETQITDQFFMEPECGLAWYDRDKNELALLLGSQSPEFTLRQLGVMLEKAKPPYSTISMDAYFPYLGGGFGGKDRSMVPFYVALAGLFGDGRPVRLALDRFEQFQLGIKRHPMIMEGQLGVDPKTGEFLAFACDLRFGGGGLANYSVTVADVSAASVPSIYYLPKSDITTVADASRAVTAGSMRGFGALQSLTATECLVDEIAVDLKMDPFALRRKNALKTGQLNFAGNTASGALRTIDVLDAMERSKLWSAREENRRNFEAANPSKSYGIGVSCVMYQFGSGADGALASVSIDADGRISAVASSVEMGTGISTAVALRVADYLGHNADSVSLDSTGPHWAPLQLTTSGDPWSISQADQDRAAKNPRWVPTITSDAGASMGAHVTTEAVAEAAEIILRFGLFPAAKAIWSDGILGGEALGEPIEFDDLRWVDGALAGSGMEPLPLERVAKKAHEMGLVTGSMVHVFNRWSWARSNFNINDTAWERPIDALALRRGGGDWTVLDRSDVRLPSAILERLRVNYYSCSGALVALGVDRTNGQVEVLDVHQVMECGRPIVPQVVSGVTQGGIIMGIGHALHEYLPHFEDGPGNGTWNVNRYHVPHGRDVPIWNTTVDILPPLSETDPPKGMGEIGIIPVVPAILNAIRDATGVRFHHTPVTAEDIRKAL